VGLGGFIDGIVFHQILQWHHMFSEVDGYPSTTVQGLEGNTLWDGLFHAVAYLFVLAGVTLLWHRQRGANTARPWRRVVGWALTGWGLFNLVEGIVDHHLLQIHHVRPGPHQLAYDLGFLALGGLLLLVGWALAQRP
jgi:uncharacterized membrane protein